MVFMTSFIYQYCFMRNMSQFSDEIVEVSFVESTSNFNETYISTNVSICKNEGQPVKTLFNQILLLWGRLSLQPVISKTPRKWF